jgi:hypothetical protein
VRGKTRLPTVSIDWCRADPRNEILHAPAALMQATLAAIREIASLDGASVSVKQLTNSAVLPSRLHRRYRTWHGNTSFSLGAFGSSVVHTTRLPRAESGKRTVLAPASLNALQLGHNAPPRLVTQRRALATYIYSERNVSFCRELST